MFDKNTLQNLSDSEVISVIAELKNELEERTHRREEKEMKSASEFKNVVDSAAANGIHYYIRVSGDEIYLENYFIYCSIS